MPERTVRRFSTGCITEPRSRARWLDFARPGTPHPGSPRGDGGTPEVRGAGSLVLGTPLEEVWRRVAANAERPVRRGVSAAILERHLATFEWPGEDEPHRVVRDVDELEGWLAVEAARW